MLSKTSLPNTREPRFSFMWSSTSFILLYFISKIIMIHFELIFVKVCISVYWFCFNIFNLRKCLKLLSNIPISQQNINSTSILQLFHDNFMIFPCHIFLFLLELQQNIQNSHTLHLLCHIEIFLYVFFFINVVIYYWTGM